MESPKVSDVVSVVFGREGGDSVTEQANTYTVQVGVRCGYPSVPENILRSFIGLQHSVKL